MSFTPTFSLAERQRRWSLARDFLQHSKLKAMIVFGEHEDAGAAPYAFDNWFTNDRPGTTVVFPLEGDPIVLVPFMNHFADHIDGLAFGESVWVPAENMRAGRDARALIDTLETLQLKGKDVGVLGLEPALPWHPEGIMPFNLWDGVTRHFPDTAFKSIGAEFIPLLMALSQEEQEVVRHAAAIGEEMSKAVVRSVKVGAAESDIYAAAMTTAFSSGTVVPWMHLNTGPRAVLWGPPRWAWRAQRPRTLESGDLVASEIFSCFGGRHTQHQVTVAIAPVRDEILQAGRIARESYLAGIEALKPGARFGDVATAMMEPIEKADAWVKGPQIHSLNPLAALCGFPAPSHLISKGYPKVKGIPTVMADMVLKPGMTFAFEPSCGFGDTAVTLGGTVMVGEDGPIELNSFTTELHTVH